MRWMIGIFLFILLSSCSVSPTGSAVVLPPVEPTELFSVFFCAVDDCEGALLTVLGSAQQSIDCAFFELDLESVEEALSTKEEQGVRVRLVIDNENKEEGQPLFSRYDTSSQYSHNKFCIVDGHTITTGSLNPTNTGVGRNDENLVVIGSTYLSHNYADEFEELWEGRFGKGEKTARPVLILNGSRIENYFCPEDRCSERVSGVLLGANMSIEFAVFSFTDARIANIIVVKNQTLFVRGVLEKSQSGPYSQIPLFLHQGVSVRLESTGATLHHKVFVVDNRTVIVGSYNPTKSGDTNNDENILIIHSPAIAQKFSREIERIWKRIGEERV